MGLETDNELDEEDWESEQKKLERDWYGLDEGYDETHNPFSDVSEEYVHQKEEQPEQKKKKRVSAKQKQIQKTSQPKILHCISGEVLVKRRIPFVSEQQFVDIDITIHKPSSAIFLCKETYQ